MPREFTGDQIDDAGIGDQLDDTGIGDEPLPKPLLPAPSPTSPRSVAAARQAIRASAGGRVAMRGHPRGPATATLLSLVPSGEGGVRLEVEVRGPLHRAVSRELSRADYLALFERLRLASVAPGGGALDTDRVGAIELHLALGDLVIDMAVDGRTAARLAAVADALLHELAIAGIPLSPDLHPIDPADRKSAAAIDGDDDEDTQVF